jgi:PIN domain nuclease of toxin-antitoxin system
VRFLLDTCTFLWLTANPERLPARIISAIEKSENDLVLSVASAWEISIKYRLRRLDLPDQPNRYIPQRLSEYRIRSLAIGLTHVIEAAAMPLHHNDPFDRLLIGQAVIENLTIITPDAAFLPYAAPVFW